MSGQLPTARPRPDGDGLHVVVPWVMSAGIIASVAALIIDAAYRLLPLHNGIRTARKARAVHTLTTDAARAAAVAPPEGAEPRRRLLPRWAFALVGAALAALALSILAVAIRLHGTLGLTTARGWVLGWGIAACVVFLVPVLPALVVAAAYYHLPPRWVAILAFTPLGRVHPPHPPPDPRISVPARKGAR